MTVASIVLFLTQGLNYGIDFTGGTLIEVRNTSGAADLAKMRVGCSTVSALGDVSLQSFGSAQRRADPPAAAARRR